MWRNIVQNHWKSEDLRRVIKKEIFKLRSFAHEVKMKKLKPFEVCLAIFCGILLAFYLETHVPDSKDNSIMSRISTIIQDMISYDKSFREMMTSVQNIENLKREKAKVCKVEHRRVLVTPEKSFLLKESESVCKISWGCVGVDLESKIWSMSITVHTA